MELILVNGFVAIMWMAGIMLFAVPVLYAVAWCCDKWDSWRRPKSAPWQEDEHIQEFLPPWDRGRK
jgi:hypothetical protein